MYSNVFRCVKVVKCCSKDAKGAQLVLIFWEYVGNEKLTSLVEIKSDMGEPDISLNGSVFVVFWFKYIWILLLVEC